MKLLIVRSPGDDFNVWATLEGHDALTDTLGFVIGCGDSRDAAVANAVENLEDAIEQLQSPPGKVEERIGRR